MRFEWYIAQKKYAVETTQSIDLSIAINCNTKQGAKAWYIDGPSKTPNVWETGLEVWQTEGRLILMI